MENSNGRKAENEKISGAIVDFHKKVKKYLEGKSMIDGYTVTVRDTIEAARFINRFKDSLGTAQALVLGLSRQYLLKLKNEDKAEVVERLKEIDLSVFMGEQEAPHVDDLLYLGGKSSYMGISRVLGSYEREQLGNLFHTLTLRAPESLQYELQIIYQVLLSRDSRLLVPAVKIFTLLPDAARKVIVELGTDIFSDEPDVFHQLLLVAATVNDTEWKEGLVENVLLLRLWGDGDDESLNVRVRAIEGICSSIEDNGWKCGIIDKLLLQKLSSVDNDIRAASAGAIWAFSTGLEDEAWAKWIIENNLLQLITDKNGAVSAWALRGVGKISLCFDDVNFKKRVSKDNLQPQFFHSSDAVRVAAVEAMGAILSGLDDDVFRREIVESYLLEKLFDNRYVQAMVMRSLGAIFSRIDDDEWKQGVVINEIMPRLTGMRENQAAIISHMQDIFPSISDDEWKQGVVADYFLPKLQSQDWYIHAKTIGMLGALNSGVDSGEWKMQILEEHILPRLSFDDNDIQSAAAAAVGVLAGTNGAEEWRRGVLNNILLPKSQTAGDDNVRKSVYGAIRLVAAAIDDEHLHRDIIRKYMTKGFGGGSWAPDVSADAVCGLISLQFGRWAAEAEGVFLENLQQYLGEDVSEAVQGENPANGITWTDDSVSIGRFEIKRNREGSPYIPDKAESLLVNTKTTIEDMEHLAASVLIDKPVLEIGPTATRKSSLIQYLAFLTNTPYRRFNLNGQTDKYEFIGGYKPQSVTISFPEACEVIRGTLADCEHEVAVSVVTKLTGERHSRDAAFKFLENRLNEGNSLHITNIATLILDSDSCLEWQDGILIDALKNGYYLNLDELNLSETEVLERINSLLDDAGSVVVYEHENEKYIKEDAYEEHIRKYLELNNDKTRQAATDYLTNQNIYRIDANFRLFATMNPKEYKGRNKLSDPFLNRWLILRIEELPDEELADIIRARYDVPDDLILSVILFHQSLREQAAKGVLGKKQREEYHFTIRELLRVFERITAKGGAEGDDGGEGRRCNPEYMKRRLAKAVEDVYGLVFRDDEDRKKYCDFYRKAFGSVSFREDEFAAKYDRSKYIDTADSAKIVVGHVDRVGLAVFGGNQSPRIPSKAAILSPVKTTLRYIKTIAQSLNMNEAIHLIGATASAKTSIIRYLAYLTNSGFQRVSLAGQTDTADIIGQYQAARVRGQYAWQDGTLLQAMRKGDYLLLDELNLAEPQILERLNSLLDTGRIVISEHDNETYVRADRYDGMVSGGEITANDRAFVRVHENFRIVAASNPVDVRHQGRTRLSLAFRNRFREIWMEEIDAPDELAEIVENALSGNIKMV